MPGGVQGACMREGHRTLQPGVHAPGEDKHSSEQPPAMAKLNALSTALAQKGAEFQMFGDDFSLAKCRPACDGPGSSG